jgi:hypothetical protein
MEVRPQRFWPPQKVTCRPKLSGQVETGREPNCIGKLIHWLSIWFANVNKSKNQWNAEDLDRTSED